jgi:hypothetical protein
MLWNQTHSISQRRMMPWGLQDSTLTMVGYF